jgi:polynucleotide 5'-triphosphatase
MTLQGVDQLEKSHELEIEVSTRAILQQGRLAANEEPNEYPALVEGFLDNMRILARVVPPPQY